ncbi:PIG-L family deacetylase [Streptomyces sp. NPDC001941]|uniref:PIG-L deacetylase family protein n=1 Tax=Streptomyces sp. NPDC001941 TaxID=3154659 RepID=UPI0033214FF8
MTFTDPIQAPGTDERIWQRWQGWAALPTITLESFSHVVVVAAHPDDEVLGFGGSLALLAAAGAHTTVVSVTDGEASHPRSRVLTAAGLARLRAGETRAALGELGAPQSEVIRLHVPDTAVAEHEDAVVRALVPLLSGADLVVAPWSGDAHGDHEAAGRATVRAAEGRPVTCWQYPVWMWHWAAPADDRVPWHRAARIQLPPRVRRLKEAAVGRFTTQIRPLGPGPDDAAILPPEEVAHHLRDFEVVFR